MGPTPHLGHRWLPGATSWPPTPRLGPLLCPETPRGPQGHPRSLRQPRGPHRSELTHCGGGGDGRRCPQGPMRPPQLGLQPPHGGGHSGGVEGPRAPRPRVPAQLRPVAGLPWPWVHHGGGSSGADPPHPIPSPAAPWRGSTAPAPPVYHHHWFGAQDGDDDAAGTMWGGTLTPLFGGALGRLPGAKLGPVSNANPVSPSGQALVPQFPLPDPPGRQRGARLTHSGPRGPLYWLSPGGRGRGRGRGRRC